MALAPLSIHLTRDNLYNWNKSRKDFIADKLCMPGTKEPTITLNKDYANSLQIDVLGYDEKILPEKLSHISAAIDNAKYITSLEDDWDSDGAVEVPLHIFNRAIKLIRDYSTSLLSKYDLVLVAPHISPLKDGSIDLLWETKRNSLLVNIKNNNSNDAFYYGVLDIKNEKIDFNGKIKTNSILPFFSDWLKEYQMENKANS